MRVILRVLAVALLAAVLVVPVWSSTTNHSLPHSLTPVLGTSVFISHARLLQTGEEVGVPLSHSHCFTHQMTAHSAHFRAGDVWEICVDDSSPPVPLTRTLTTPSLTDLHSPQSPLPHSHTTIHPQQSIESYRPVATTITTATTTTTTPVTTASHVTTMTVTIPNITIAYVTANSLDTIPPNATACDPNIVSSDDICNLRAAVLYCEEFLSTLGTGLGHECQISLPPMGELTLDPSRGELRLDLAYGTLRVVGNACSLRPLSSSTSTTRLFQIQDTTESYGFTFLLSNMTVSEFGSDDWDGGAIYMRSVSVTVESVIFDSNSGLAGGALCFHKCKGVNVMLSQFVKNTAASDGGAIHFSVDNMNIGVTDCQFIKNSVLVTSVSPIGTGGAYMGGAICVTDANEDITVSKCAFHNNTAFRAGAVAFYRSNSHIVLSQSVFVHNWASNTVGGVDFSFSNSMVSVIECEFSLNYGANSGGLRFFDGNGGVHIIDCIFRENTGLDSGGGISISDGNSDITLSGILFERNICTAGGRGGALLLRNQNVFIDIINCTFIQNVIESGFGGAICLFYQNSLINIIDCVFEDNIILTTGNGGALYIDNDNNVDLQSLVFVRNRAPLGNGGGVYLTSRNDNIVCDSVVFINNAAGSNGGALAFVTDNVNSLIMNCTFIGNTAGVSGGAVYSALANTGISVSDSIFKFNEAGMYGGALYIGEQHRRTISVLNTVMEYNMAFRAGAIFVLWHNDHILVDGCTVRFNIAARSAGAFRSLALAATITNSIFSGNAAVQDHGGVYLDFAMRVNIVNTVISNNTAYGEFEDLYSDIEAVGCGGLGFFNTYNVVINNCTLDSNTAHLTGGAVCILYTDNVMIRNTLINGNTAITGGAVHVFNSINITIDSVLVENNTVKGNGGGMAVTGSSVIFKNNSFLHNTAKMGSGSACALQESVVSLWDNSFDGNEALEGAGTVFWNHHLVGAQEPTGLRDGNNNFSSSNIAAYGNLWATNAMALEALHDSNVIDIIDYEEFVSTITISLQDFYGQQVVTEYEGFAQLLVSSDSSRQSCGDEFLGNVGGSVLEKFIGGIAKFAKVNAFCEPGGVMFMNATSDLNVYGVEIELRFRPCVVGEFFAERVCSPCANGTYSFTDPALVSSLTDELDATVCRPCPAGAERCFKDQIVVERGHWRIHSSAESMLDCPWGDGSCLGGFDAGDASCGSQYTGPLCAVCEEDYFHMDSTNKCMSCHDTTSWLDPFTITALVILVLCLTIGGYYFNLMIREQELQSFTELFIYSVLKLKLVDTDVYVNAPLAVNENILILNRRLRALLKMYITFFQVVSSIPAVLHFHDFPDGFQVRMVQLSAVVNIGISRSAIFHCLFGWTVDFVDELLFVTIYPAVILFLFVAVYHVHMYIKMGRHSHPPTTESASYRAEAGIVRAKYVEIFLLFTYLILPSLVVTIFETFRCQTVDPDGVNAGGDSYLRADYSISCHSSRYHFAVAWAVLMIFVYVLGVPSFYFYLLYSNRSAIMTRDLTAVLVDERGNSAEQQQLTAVRFLFDSYKPSFWYWELVETAFRLSLTGFLVLGVYAGDNAQMVLGFGIALLFVKLFEYFDPYLDDVSQSSKIVTMWEISIIFFIFILIKSDFISDSAIVAIGLVLVVTVFMNLAVALLRILWQFFDSTSTRNLEALGSRDRSISGSTLNSWVDVDGVSQRGSRHLVTSVVFSPFDVEGKLTRKEIKIGAQK